jgi:hypothetical protein
MRLKKFSRTHLPNLKTTPNTNTPQTAVLKQEATTMQM